jgi:peptidoglycan-associated lipoprotein
MLMQKEKLMKPSRRIQFLVLLVLVAVGTSGCRGFLGNTPLGRWFGRSPFGSRGPSGVESSVLPEPIRDKTAQEIPELKRIYFAFDSAELLEPAKTQLRQNAEWLKIHRNVHVQIEGHCDERGTVEYNYALGQKRADAARAFLISEGIAPSRLHTISYGAERPEDPSHNEMAWARNRRVQFLIYGE